jgi:glycosyltransferase involved in cell wall biosynthesis
MSKFGVKKGTYFFSMSSIAPTKNFKWVIEAAKQNRNHIFIIAGGTDPKSFGISSLEEVPNVRYVGRVSDEDAKLLMRDCKAFLFPSYYEGFGIPPMEALACGASEVVVSDIPVMHEVCGTSAHYIDPFDYRNIDMNRIMCGTVSDGSYVLEKYGWEESAKILLNVLKK